MQGAYQFNYMILLIYQNYLTDTHSVLWWNICHSENYTYKFSAIAHDQCHKQQNAIVKGYSGVIGITENEEALQLWWLLVQK